jgi:hypothetical protein
MSLHSLFPCLMAASAVVAQTATPSITPAPTTTSYETNVISEISTAVAANLDAWLEIIPDVIDAEPASLSSYIVSDLYSLVSTAPFAPVITSVEADIAYGISAGLAEVLSAPSNVVAAVPALATDLVQGAVAAVEDWISENLAADMPLDSVPNALATQPDEVLAALPTLVSQVVSAVELAITPVESELETRLLGAFTTLSVAYQNVWVKSCTDPAMSCVTVNEGPNGVETLIAVSHDNGGQWWTTQSSGLVTSTTTTAIASSASAPPAPSASIGGEMTSATATMETTASTSPNAMVDAPSTSLAGNGGAQSSTAPTSTKGETASVIMLPTAGMTDDAPGGSAWSAGDSEYAGLGVVQAVGMLLAVAIGFVLL